MRPSCLKVKGQKKGKTVQWSPEVDEMERQHPRVKNYPKEKVSKSAFYVDPTELMTIPLKD